jgi:hypothetical protein
MPRRRKHQPGVTAPTTPRVEVSVTAYDEYTRSASGVIDTWIFRGGCLLFPAPLFSIVTFGATERFGSREELLVASAPYTQELVDALREYKQHPAGLQGPTFDRSYQYAIEPSESRAQAMLAVARTSLEAVLTMPNTRITDLGQVTVEPCQHLGPPHVSINPKPYAAPSPGA